MRDPSDDHIRDQRTQTDALSTTTEMDWTHDTNRCSVHDDRDGLDTREGYRGRGTSRFEALSMMTVTNWENAEVIEVGACQDSVIAKTESILSKL